MLFQGPGRSQLVDVLVACWWHQTTTKWCWRAHSCVGLCLFIHGDVLVSDPRKGCSGSEGVSWSIFDDK